VRIGRFVRHKGVAWFLQNVVPLLSNDIVFVAAGGVPQNAIPGDSNIFPECQKIVQELHLEGRVRLLKNIPWSDIQVLLNTSDIAVAPNIPVAGSFEGFGIAALEAGACELPIVAAKLEGLQEAIQDEKNGFLVPPENAEAFTKKIEWLLADESRRQTIGIHAAAFVTETYHWNILSERYLDLLADFRKSTLDTH
jgi:glycosyltransferase involved in cell wall biosynthesis